MLSQKVDIQNDRGDTLSGVMEWPANGVVQAYAVFAHCFTCGKNSHAARHISKLLSSRGIAVLRFDFAGIGESEGKFADTNFSSNVQDLLTFIDYLTEENMPPQLLIGHSLGGAAVLAAASQRGLVKAVATIGAPARPAHVAHLLPKGMEKMAPEDTIKVKLGIHTMKMKKQFLDDIENQNTPEMLFGLHKAVLIAHSPEDEIVSIENAQQIFKNLHHPKSFLSLDGMTHLVLKKEQARYIANVVYEWAKRYITLADFVSTDDKDPVVTAVLGGEKYTTAIRTGKHALVADEPKEMGGRNHGPSPYQYLSAGLAACTAMTIRMYVDRKGWDVGEIKVTVDHEKKHIKDSQDKTGRVDHFVRTVHVEKEITEEQKNRIMKIADKCPVHRTLMGEVEIPTTWEE